MAKKKDAFFSGLLESLGQGKDIAAGKPVPGARVREYSIAPARDFNPQAIRRIRKRLHFTQEMLAQFLEVSLATVRSWEQGHSSPLGPSRRLLEGLDRCAAELLEAYERIKVVSIPEDAGTRRASGE
jgi:putative transcriptional regulator